MNIASMPSMKRIANSQIRRQGFGKLKRLAH